MASVFLETSHRQLYPLGHPSDIRGSVTSVHLVGFLPNTPPPALGHNRNEPHFNGAGRDF